MALLCLLRINPAPAAPENQIPILIFPEELSGQAVDSLERPLNFPGEQFFYLSAPTSGWSNIRSVDFSIQLPEDAPTNMQVVVHVKDWDSFWYQNLLPGHLLPGRKTSFRIDLSPDSKEWKPRDHLGAWHFRALAAPQEFGIRILSDQPFKGTARLENVVGIPVQNLPPPYIRNVMADKNNVACFEKLEVSFEIPDRYMDPFDARQVSATAEITTPAGKIIRVDAFYSHRFYWEKEPGGQRVMPQGSPFWRVRFAPFEQGIHSYTIHVRDRHGEAAWGPGRFTAEPPRTPGFVRVSAKDPRYLEFDDGSSFFPIGHNIRSPFDTRMDSQFPWKQRKDEGTSVYLRYFKAMQENGENLAEIWSAAWSLGLEWSPIRPGYHGVGQFNMFHAWELDQILAEAEQRGIYINLVIHNHGKFTTHLDAEWEFNPFNKKNGGYLDSPDDYFSDPRALESFRKLMRYMVARWGYSTSLFAWALWSELDLTGTDPKHTNYKRPEVVEWHRLMGGELKKMDPYTHLVSSHVSGDYNKQNPEIAGLPEMDICPVDAYHFSKDPVHIVDLMKRTADYNAKFKKPVLITEFGGSHMAQSLEHLEDTLHAGLWASPAIALGGAPLFWWWQVIDEENLYPKFKALSRFMAGVDRRDPLMTPKTVRLLVANQSPAGLNAICMSNREQALGWIYHTEEFASIDPLGKARIPNLKMIIPEMTNGIFLTEFWNTMTGEIAATGQTPSKKGTLTITAPPLARDMAFKVRRIAEPAK